MIDGRAGAMAVRLMDTAERLGIDSPGRGALRAAFEVGMAPRVRAGLDEHHPDYLHPARSALILMDDAGVVDAAALAAALVTETRDASLRPDPERLAGLGESVAGLVGAVPDPAAGERVLEDLVVAPGTVLMIALAERLDHARHLHLRPRNEWEPYHAVTCSAYAPAARRGSPVLRRRLEWWCGAFRRRFLEER